MQRGGDGNDEQESGDESKIIPKAEFPLKGRPIKQRKYVRENRQTEVVREHSSDCASDVAGLMEIERAVHEFPEWEQKERCQR